ncbi:MAG: 1-deoxy-D-xylulose-5-phosphate reductoisomerase [Spirochaetes bacterium]|nr:1-deoxy-D-xylulose-5-phosphate reductoisomerase [Spirochaetota bacterium]
MRTKNILVLGATGSIGRQTIAFIDEANSRCPGSFSIIGMSAHSDVKMLLAAANLHMDAKTALTGLSSVSERIDFSGQNALERLIGESGADLAVNGIAGSPGLKASALVIAAGMDLALANKESVVMGWALLEAMAAHSGSKIIPVDSEHAALFQLVGRIGSSSIVELTITASGGPFRDRDMEYLWKVKPDEAAAHPVWRMGRKISIDSASLANKGLELIEASRLYKVDESQIRILIHPQSLVHALVRTIDGSLYAHLSPPDMRIPLGIALSWPEERPLPFPGLDLAGKSLEFRDPDPLLFPMLPLARQALREGEAAAIAYNAADEAAVEAFDASRIGFMDIPLVVEKVLSRGWAYPARDMSGIFEFDAAARSAAHNIIAEICR